MKPAELYDLLEQAATKYPADEPLFSVPAQGSQPMIERMTEKFSGFTPKQRVYPRDILDFLRSIT